MRFAIADPPYLGRAERHYGPGAYRRPEFGSGPARAAAGMHPATTTTTRHPEAWKWDDPLTHQQLVRRLHDEYDGWAVSMWPTSLSTYLAVAPMDARVCAWVKKLPVPGGSRVVTAWEPVLVYVPGPRRGRGTGLHVLDVLTADPARNGHVGAKPPAWTRWILTLLGYDPEIDTVDDLFPGSGAVSEAIAQTSLDFGGMA